MDIFIGLLVAFLLIGIGYELELVRTAIVRVAEALEIHQGESGAEGKGE